MRIPPGSVQLAGGGEPIAAVQVSRIGLYVLGVEVIESNADLALHMLIEAAQKVGAERVVDVHLDATPPHGVWWFFTHVIPFWPSARASGIAVKGEAAGAVPAAPAH